jgi:hypothetical protein
MRGTHKFCGIVLILGAAMTARSASSSRPNSQLTVYVSDSANTPGRSLFDAEHEAARIFKNAGIAVKWVNCSRSADASRDSRCQQVPAPGEFAVRIIPRARQAPSTVFGTSFLGPSGGVYADIFFDRVQLLRDIDPNLSVAPILGDVIAHELGHLLLGENSHTHTGLMQPSWQYPQLRLIEMGHLQFDAGEAAHLRERLEVLRSNACVSPQGSTAGP